MLTNYKYIDIYFFLFWTRK